LNEDAHFIVAEPQVIVDLTPSRRARHGAAYTANAARRVARGRDHLPRLLSRIDHGNDQRLCADIQVLLDQIHRSAYGAHDGMDRVWRHRLQLRQHAARIVGCMLCIDHQTIESGARQ